MNEQCDRCESNGRTREATTFLAYRHYGDCAHWEDQTAVRCDDCAQALRDYCKLPQIGTTITLDEAIR
jgi:hypothetical protein